MSVISARPFLLSVLFVLAAASNAIVPVASAAEEILYEQKLQLPIQLAVPATVDGHTYTFILDTGCAVECLDPAFSSLMGPYRSTGELATATAHVDLLNASTVTKRGLVFGDDVALKMYDTPPTAIGKWNVPSSQASVFDLQPIRELLGLDIRGIVGPAELQEEALLLDFDHNAFKIMRGTIALPSDMKSLKLEEDPYHLPIIKPEFEGKETEFLIDTGNSGCLSLRHDIFTDLVARGVIDQEMSPAPTQTLLGTVSIPSGHFTRGLLLGVNLTGMPVSDNGEISSAGMAFLLNFNAVIDFKGATFSYQGRRALPPISPHKMLGAALKFSDGRNHIFILDPHHSAARDAGLQLWDRITRLGPLKEPELNYLTLYQLCLDRAGDSLEVEVARPGVKEPLRKFITLPELQFDYAPRKQ